MPYVLPEKTYMEWKLEVDALKAEIADLKARQHSYGIRGDAANEVVLRIQDILDETVWEMSMLSEIADLLTDNGWAVRTRK